MTQDEHPDGPDEDNPDGPGEDNPDGPGEDNLDEDTDVVLSRFARLLSISTDGGKRKCGSGCGDWIEEGEQRAKILLMFPEEDDSVMEAAGSHMSRGSAPLHYCMDCYEFADNAGDILIEP